MEKEGIDNYYSRNYDDILTYIKKSFSKHNLFHVDPNFFLSESYLYMIKNIDKIDDELELKKFISTFIHNNTYWYNSSVRECEVSSRKNRNREFDLFKHNFIIDEGYERLDEDILFEEYRVINELYYKSLKSVEKRIIWEIYFIEGMTTGLKFSEYIGMSHPTGNNIIRELRRELKEFYIEYKKGNL